MTPTLEPCPCCGGAAQLKDTRGARIRQGWVGCPACGLYKSWKIDPAGAIRIWNTRTSVSSPPIFDREEIIRGCTVQVLSNSVTGEVSVGWWKEAEA